MNERIKTVASIEESSVKATEGVGSITAVSTPTRIFSPSEKAPVFAVANAVKLGNDTGSIQAVAVSQERYLPANCPPLFKTPDDYMAKGVRLISINPPAVIEEALISDDADIELGEPFERPDGVYVKTSAKKIARISNFSVRILSKVIMRTLRGDDRYYLLELRGKKLHKRYQISACAYLNLAAKLRRESPAYTLYPDSGKQEAYFKVYLSQLVEDAEGKLEEYIVYTYHGWQPVGLGQWHYFSGIDEQCNSAFSLIDLTSIPMDVQHASDVFAWHVLDIGNSFVMVPMFLHSHTGYLKRLFEEAGVPVRFIMDLCGPTGIGKTLLMELLFCPFMKAKQMVNFTSTSSGIERWFSQFHDRNAVIDDLSTVTNRATMSLHENILRQYCDDNARVVAARGGDGYKSADLCFGLTMTSETNMEGASQSSQLRKVSVPMTADSLIDDVVEEFKLHVLQEPKIGKISPLDIYVTSFIRFLESNFEEVVAFIRRFEPPPVSKKFRRHAAAYRVLATEAQIILRYFVGSSVLTEAQAQEIFMQHWIPLLQGLVNYNSSLGQQSDPVRVFLDTLSQDIAARIVVVADNRALFEHDANLAMGFWMQEKNGVKLVLDTDRAYQVVKSHFDKMRIPFTVAPNQLLQLIANRGLSEVYQRKNRKSPKPLKEFTINGIQMKLLVLRWDEVQHFLNSN